MEEKIYLNEGGIYISNKVWCIGGLNSADYSESSFKLIPVNAIASVNLVRNTTWWLWLLFGILIGGSGLGYGIYELVEGWSEELGIIYISAGGLILFLGIIIAVVLYRRRLIEILTNSKYSRVHLRLRNERDANHYLTPMITCLREREQV